MQQHTYPQNNITIGMIVVYWYLFSNHYTLNYPQDNITKERERERDLLGNNVHDGGVQGAAR